MGGQSHTHFSAPKIRYSSKFSTVTMTITYTEDLQASANLLRESLLLPHSPCLYPYITHSCARDTSQPVLLQGTPTPTGS